jgi:hypothetical protein
MKDSQPDRTALATEVRSRRQKKVDEILAKPSVRYNEFPEGY